MKKYRRFFIVINTVVLLCGPTILHASPGGGGNTNQSLSATKGMALQPPLVNIISLSSDDTVCYNTSPGIIMGSNHGAAPGVIVNFQWQSSTVSGNAGFADIPFETNQVYTPASLTQTIWFRRILESEGVYDTSNFVKVNVLPPTIDLVITNPSAVCAPETINLTATAIVAGSPSGLAYSYFTNPEATNAAPTPSAISSFTNLDTYYYIKAVNKCTSAVAPVHVVINQKPDLSVVGVSSPVCKGQTVELYAYSPGNTTQWIGIGAGPTVNVQPVTSTTYTAEATNPQGCKRTATTDIVINSFEVTLSTATAQPTAGIPVSLQASANQSFDAVAWTPAHYFPVQTQAKQTITINDTARTFSVTGVNEDGCRDTAFVTVSLNANTNDIFIPNAFTPNKDGKNDIFKVYGSSIKEVEIRVYTQWGNLICDTKDNIKGWDGSYLGVQQPIGIYMYSIKIRLDNEDSFIRKGSINLIR